MNVIAFNGSPHKDGTIATGIARIAAELQKEGIDVAVIHVGNKEIHGCMACGKCREKGLCAISGDIVNECIEKTRAADGIILGSPVYYGGIAGSFKCFLDRMFYTGVNLRYKVGAVVASCRRSGGIATFQELCNYLNLGGAVITPTEYWNIIHGNNKQDVQKDSEGLWTMQVVGRNMAWLMKILETGKQSLPPPDNRPRVWTNFIH